MRLLEIRKGLERAAKIISNEGKETSDGIKRLDNGAREQGECR